jgi:hypothetical protein
MALKVLTDPAPTNKLTVSTNNGGMQTTYNPQQTAPVKYVQNATPPQPLQATRTPLQGGNSSAVQPAATAQQIAQAAEAQRQAVAQEVARQKEVRRGQVQGQVDSRTVANQSALKLKVENVKLTGRLSVGRNYYPSKIAIPKYEYTNADGTDAEYDQIKEAAKQQAMKYVEGTKADPSSGGLSRFVDKVTFGADRRASGARKFAEQQATQFADRQIKVYEGKLNAHNSLQATLQADYEAKKLRLSAEELNTLADQYNAKLSASLKDLKNVEAYTVGTIEGYGLKSEEKLTSRAATAVGSLNRNVVQKLAQNPAWKYTLGGGSENIPSVVTAPARALNWLGNINTSDRNIYQTGGTTTNRLTTGKNAWQTTFNQRNNNTRPWVDVSPANAPKQIRDEVTSLINVRKQNGETNSDKLDYEKILAARMVSYNRSKRGFNSVQELASDPLNIPAGELVAAKNSKYVSKLDEVGRASKYTSKFFSAADKITEAKNAFKTNVLESKLVKWLGSEAKTPEQLLSEAIDIAKREQGVAQKNLIPRLREINKQLPNSTTDFSVFDDFAKLTDSESKMLQRMKAGKLSPSDRLRLAGKQYQPIRDKLEAIAVKWEKFSEDMRAADNVTNTRFGKGKRTYSPNTVWTRGDLKQYNFRMKRGKYIQNSEDFAQGAVDRYLKSNVGKNNKAGRAALNAEREQLIKEYEATVGVSRSNVEKYYNKTQIPYNKIRKVAGAPTRLWKKSVLKYRPAWTVNNVAYNMQAGVLSGGAGFIPEQLKMLNPRYSRKVYDNIPEGVKVDLAKEFGGSDKLSKFYNSIENSSHISAFNALKKKGLTDEQAMKRVGKYFFDNKVKNIERPLRAAVPFYSFQKNLIKAGATMPFDKPLAAIAYNRLDKYQQTAFKKDFQTVIPKLKELGYTDEEITQIEAEQSKYYAGRLKVGNKYINTPFNAFSEKGLTGGGFNPYLSALSETADATDSFGRPISGNEASLVRRLTSKFPQAEIAYKKYKADRVARGLEKPSVKYISKSGSEGYGLTKEKQGYDSSKPNYVASMDPRTKTKQDVGAFLGKPRGLEFNKDSLVESKKLQKVTAEYFAKSADWKKLDFEKSNAAQKEFFAKYGMTPDDFYKGVLAKYDSENTQQIKSMKESAASQNKSLFEEYARQPAGTKNVWATDKLIELTKAGYFNDNPFLKSFKWINKETVAKAGKQKAVQYAVKTGDWSAYKKLYGMTNSQKSKDLAAAETSGDWSLYKQKYGIKPTPYTADGQYFKTAESKKKYLDGLFWRRYAEASKSMRKKLLAENPQYNSRSNWTQDQWDKWKSEDRASKIAKLSGLGIAGQRLQKHRQENISSAMRYKTAQTSGRSKKKVAYA